MRPPTIRGRDIQLTSLTPATFQCASMRPHAVHLHSSRATAPELLQQCVKRSSRLPLSRRLRNSARRTSHSINGSGYITNPRCRTATIQTI